MVRIMMMDIMINMTNMPMDMIEIVMNMTKGVRMDIRKDWHTTRISRQKIMTCKRRSTWGGGVVWASSSGNFLVKISK